MKLITIKNLSKTYHTKNSEIKAIDNINLTINEYEKIAIVGASGSGKSTLLNIISKLDNDYKGTIDYKDNLTFGYMFQTDCLLPFKTVYENAILGLKLKHELNESTKEYTIGMLKKYGLYEFRNNYPDELSGGQRQRLALIRTLAIKPDILLLDEAFSKLDQCTKDIIINDVKELINDLNITTILITHDIKEAINLGDYIIVLSKRPSRIKRIHKKDEEDLYNTIWNEINE